MQNFTLKQLIEVGEKWTKLVDDHLDFAVSLRERIHASPRISGDETDTKTSSSKLWKFNCPK